MSSFDTTTLPCPHCHADNAIDTATSVNVSNRPWARDQVLQGDFHRFQCRACAGRISVERDFLYVDSDARLFIAVYDLATIGDWQALERRTEQTVIDVLGEMVPRAEELLLSYDVRTVFGLDGLADKVRIFEAGLDDAVVELLKLELFTTESDVNAPPGREIYVSEVALVDDELEFTAMDRSGAREPLHFAADLKRYRELESARPGLIERFPNLFHRTFRSFRRLASETVQVPSEDT